MGFSRLSYETLRLQLRFPRDEDCQVDGGCSTDLAAARSKFRARSLQRDQQSDLIRMLRLEKTLKELSEEVKNEFNGLKIRLVKDTNDAAFLMDAIENEDVYGAGVARVNDLESSVVYARERLKLLNKQIEYLNRFSKFTKKYPS